MRIWKCLLISLAALADVRADEQADFFNTQILPILKNRCLDCHSQEHEIEGGLALDSKAGWERGGESGPAIKPRDLKNSLLIQAIRHHDEDSAMPPKEKLPRLEIAMLETWVLLGAPDPRKDPHERPVKGDR